MVKTYVGNPARHTIWQEKNKNDYIDIIFNLTFQHQYFEIVIEGCNLLEDLYASFLKGQTHQCMFSLMKGTLWGNCNVLQEHFKGTNFIRLGCLREVSGLGQSADKVEIEKCLLSKRKKHHNQCNNIWQGGLQFLHHFLRNSQSVLFYTDFITNGRGWHTNFIVSNYIIILAVLYTSLFNRPSFKVRVGSFCNNNMAKNNNLKAALEMKKGKNNCWPIYLGLIPYTCLSRK